MKRKRAAIGWCPAARRTAAAALLAGVTGLALSPPVAARARLDRAGDAWPAHSTLALPGGELGNAVAISGTTAIAGAWDADNYRGAAYIYVRSGGTWHKQAKLVDPANSVGDYFGAAVAVSGATVIVGAIGVHSHGPGAVYVYLRSGRSWRRQATLTEPGATDYFGAEVALSDGTAIVGAYGANKSAGAAYVYARSGTAWHRQARLADPAGRAGDQFGFAVALSGATAIVGAYGANKSAGAAYVYARSGATWRRQARLADPGNATSDYFGLRVALWGATAVIGAPGVNHKVGAAYVYVRSGALWRRQATLVHPADSVGDYFGSGVAVSATTRGLRIVVGAPSSDLHRCGVAYDFARPGTSWRERAKVADPGCAVNDYFGAAVALWNRTAVIGAWGKNKMAGGVYVLTIP